MGRTIETGKRRDRIAIEIGLESQHAPIGAVARDFGWARSVTFDVGIATKTSGDLGRWEHDRVLVGRSLSSPSLIAVSIAPSEIAPAASAAESIARFLNARSPDHRLNIE